MCLCHLLCALSMVRWGRWIRSSVSVCRLSEMSESSAVLSCVQPVCRLLEMSAAVLLMPVRYLTPRSVTPHGPRHLNNVLFSKLSHCSVIRPQLPQSGAPLTDLPQHVVVHEAAEVESYEAAQVTETVGDDVEIVLEDVLGVSDVVVLTWD